MDLALHVSAPPIAVYNILTLVRQGYLDGQRFHRVVPNFVIQAGNARGDGNGGPNTGGSQFFITYAPQPHLDGANTVLGELVSGFDVLDRIIQGDRIVRVTIR